MTIKDSEANEILQEHERFVNKKRRRWDKYRAAFTDEFWTQHKWDAQSGDVSTPAVKIQVNMVRPHISSFLAGLFYKGMRVAVRIDPVTLGDKAKILDKFEPGEPQQAIGALCERFLNVENVDALSDNAFAMALLYPRCAFKLGIAKIGADDALDKVWFDAIPPWEAIWDRKSRSPDDRRYIGHTYWMSREEFMEQYGDKLDDEEKESVEWVQRPDVVADGFTAKGETKGPADSIRLFELFDFTGVYTTDGEDDEEDSEATPAESSQGTFRIYMVRGESSKEDKNRTLKLLMEEAFPFDNVDGTPMAPLLPVILTPVPEYPMQGISEAASIYEINKERNYITTYLAGAFRRDVQRVLMYRKDAVDDNFLAEVTSGKDQIMVPVEDDRPFGEIAQYIDSKPVSETIFKYLGVLGENQGETQGTADFTRGKALNYATATEVQALNDYTETTLGRIRKKMDRLLSQLCAMYLRVLRESIGDTFRVRIGKDVKEFPSELLDLPWELNLTDLANTPLAEAQRRSDFSEAAPQLMELIAVAVQTEDPVSAKLAQVSIDHLVEIYDLPEGMSWRQLSQIQPAPEPEPEPVEAAPVEGGQLTPEDEALIVEAVAADPSIAAAVPPVGIA